MSAKRSRLLAWAYDAWMYASVVLVFSPILFGVPRPYSIIMILLGMVWVFVEKWRAYK